MLVSDSSKVKGSLLGACKDFKNFCGGILGLSYANTQFRHKVAHFSISVLARANIWGSVGHKIALK
jgi:hypothetical protein